MISGKKSYLLIKRIIAYFFVILVMGLIFYFSAQPAQQSNKTSNKISKKIVKVITKNKKITPKKKADLTKKTNERIRKIAHFSLFLLLGVSVLLSALVTFIKKGKHYIQKTALFSLLFCILYAISDEIHQVYVPGRTFQISDILTDSFGSLAGMLTVLAIIKISTKKAVV